MSSTGSHRTLFRLLPLVVCLPCFLAALPAGGPEMLSTGNAIAHALQDEQHFSRQHVQLSTEEIESIFREFLLRKSSWKAEDLSIEKIRFGSPLLLPAGKMTVDVSALPSEDYLGEVGAMMHFRVDGVDVKKLRVVADVRLFQNVVHTNRALNRNDLITSADIQLLRIDVGAHPDRYTTLPEEVIGKRIVTSMKPGQPVNPKNLDLPHLVKRGDVVTVVYQQEGIRLVARGEAKQDGKMGERIRIRNVDTSKTILCHVIDAQVVEVVP
jgi:flagellar basal body P-ring formation protein FlgA